MSHAIRVLVEREVAHDCFNPAHHGPCEVCDAVAELSRTARSRPERLDAEGILERQCLVCKEWLVLECFSPVGPGPRTRHGVRPDCRDCRNKRLRSARRTA